MSIGGRFAEAQTARYDVRKLQMTARIYQKIGGDVIQHGRRNAEAWLLEHDVPCAQRADPLMGWQGSADTRGTVVLSFPSLEAAVTFADRERLDYQVIGGTDRSKSRAMPTLLSVHPANNRHAEHAAIEDRIPIRGRR